MLKAKGRTGKLILKLIIIFKTNESIFFYTFIFILVVNKYVELWTSFSEVIRLKSQTRILKPKKSIKIRKRKSKRIKLKSSKNRKK